MKTIYQQNQVSLNVKSVIPFKTWWAKRQLEAGTTWHTVIRSISVSPGQPVWLECQPQLPTTQGKHGHSYSSVTITPLSSDSFGCLGKHLQTIPAIPEITATALTCHVGISRINHLGAFLIPLRRPEISLLFRRARARTRAPRSTAEVGRLTDHTDRCGSTRQDQGITER